MTLSYLTNASQLLRCIDEMLLNQRRTNISTEITKELHSKVKEGKDWLKIPKNWPCGLLIDELIDRLSVCSFLCTLYKYFEVLLLNVFDLVKKVDEEQDWLYILSNIPRDLVIE